MAMSASEYRFGRDQGARRREDEPLLTGRGRFTDDVNVAGQAHAVFVRAPVGHAEIRAIDAGGGRGRCPACSAVFTGRDLAADGLGAHPAPDLVPGARRPADARGRDAGARPGPRALRGRAAGAGGGRDPGARRRMRPRRSRRTSRSCPPPPTSSARWLPGAPDDLAGGARQRRLRLDGRRRRRRGGGLRPRRPRRARALARHAPGALGAGAARGHRARGTRRPGATS